MYGVDRLRDIRSLEYHLFGGVPAIPEPMYASEDYYMLAGSKQPRLHSAAAAHAIDRSVVGTSGYAEFDLETGELTFYQSEAAEEGKED